MSSGADDKQTGMPLRAADRQRTGPEELAVTLRAIPASIGHLRSHAREFAAAAGASDEVVAQVALVISEATTNVVLHGYPKREAAGGTVALHGSVTDDWLELAVADRGAGFRPGPSGGLGFGLKLMAEASDSMTIRQRDEGTTVVLRFALAR